MLINAHTLPGQTEGLKGKNKVFIKPLALGRKNGWMGGRSNGWFVKVDNRFVYEKWLQGGDIGL